MNDYKSFLESKAALAQGCGFNPIEIPDLLFPFQKDLVEWAIRRGRAGLFEGCGLGKTIQQLTWADNVLRYTNRPVLIFAPLGVTHQTVREAEKFGFDCERSRNGIFNKKIVVTNYEKMSCFRSSDFSGVVCDESSILKNFQGKTRSAIIEFMRTVPYRLLCTATPSPNDYPELGNSAEALGELGYQDMITKFFRSETKNERTFLVTAWARQMKWVLKGHAKNDFWRWVCSWARACRKPSDLGFDDIGYILPGLSVNEHVVEAKTKKDGFLFDMPAITLNEQREERWRTIQERCEMVAKLVDHDRQAIVWGHLNDECDLATKLIKGAVQVSGSDSDERKEDIFMGFTSGHYRVLVSKPKIAGFGLNFQNCAHQTFFPSHSYEQWHQAICRSYRFGQPNKVIVDVVSSEGEAGVVSSLQSKADAAEKMFDRLIELMNNQLNVKTFDPFTISAQVPSWI